MKSKIEIEETLERLGNEWPPDISLANRVMRDLESITVHPAWRGLRSSPGKSLLATAATVVVFTLLWWAFPGGHSLYGKVVDGIRHARTLHMTLTAQPGANKPAQRVMQSWYERGVGFRDEVGPVVRLGNQTNFWTYVNGSKLATRSGNGGIDDIIDRMLNDAIFRLLKEGQTKRYPASDQLVDGRPCQAYLLVEVKRAADPGWQAGKKRMVILVDDRSRIARAVTEVRTDDRWAARFTADWKYDEPVDPALFAPRFGDDVRIVDADAIFDEFVDLQKAVHREERAKLWYAIHRAERFQDGGILVVSSVRGTAETLKNFPLTARRVGPGLFFFDGPAENYRASPQGSGFFRIDLASADRQGINVRWWVLVPRGTPPNHFDVGPGKVKLPVGITPCGEFAKANFADKNGVINHLTWDIVLDLAEPKLLPTLDAIARHVYADMISLEAIPFGLLDMGPKDGVEQFIEPRKTTLVQFTEAVAAHIRWWRENDIEFQLERQFTAQSQKQASKRGADQTIGLSYQSLVDDATLGRIEKRQALKRLYLAGTKITDAGLRHLAGLKELRELSLEKTSITDVGLRELEGLRSLRNLSAKDTKVTAGGIARLKAAIPGLRIKQ